MQHGLFPRSFVLTIGGFCFIASAILQTISLFGPPLAGDVEFLDWVVEQPGYTLFFTFNVLAFTILNVPAFLGATHLVRGRGEKLTYIGAITSLVGNFFFVILATEALIQRGMATLEREPMLALLQWIFDTPVYFLPHLLLFLLTSIGLLLLTIGLNRARKAPAWLIYAGAANLIAGFLELGPAQAYVQSAVMIALFGGLGWLSLKRSREADAVVQMQQAV
ncbi:hypothetical protein E5161_14170 [Cohnella pontilimi]|uniref:DUF4386 domain-containing protein n=1 Tax=Cohnella pontilimi TaxID=2564100 RepID=A0A4U0FA84_9BACL|nr:hypothetical protein [Cohnella pontilimi]TJY41540.1 hypothetical protein E5161_14170 [Cohnella pontilimi]